MTCIEIKPSPPAKKLHPKLAVKASLKKKAARLAIRTADAKMNKVHQDDDYIYPALGLCLDIRYKALCLSCNIFRGVRR